VILAGGGGGQLNAGAHMCSHGSKPMSNLHAAQNRRVWPDWSVLVIPPDGSGTFKRAPK